ENGWQLIGLQPKAIRKLLAFLDKGPDTERPGRLFDAKEYVHSYTMVYNMCTQRTPFNWSEQLYQRHGETIKKYLEETVKPALRHDKHGEFLLKELVRRWDNHKLMNKWMQKFFMYLDRYFVRHHSLPPLNEAGLKHFKTLVYEDVKKDVATALLGVI
ncbi:unnamed protein product, partial [Phaeothamnion confervicola]